MKKINGVYFMLLFLISLLSWMVIISWTNSKIIFIFSPYVLYTFEFAIIWGFAILLPSIMIFINNLFFLFLDRAWLVNLLSYSILLCLIISIDVTLKLLELKSFLLYRNLFLYRINIFLNVYIDNYCHFLQHKFN